MDSKPAAATRVSTRVTCDYCDAKQKGATKLKKCAKCRVAQYCSKECQTKHWKLHKKHCQTLTAAKAKAPSAIPSNFVHPLLKNAKDQEALMADFARPYLDPNFDILEGNSDAGLSKAVSQGDLATVKLLVSPPKKGGAKPADVNWSDPSHLLNPPLVEAAGCKDPAMTEYLLQHGAQVDISDGEQCTALYQTTQEANVPVAQMLLKAKACVDARNEDGWTPLINAAYEGHEAMVLLLLQSKGQVNSRTGFGTTPLMSSCLEGHASVAKLLLEWRADASAQDRKGSTALSFAVSRKKSRRHQECVRLLTTRSSETKET